MRLVSSWVRDEFVNPLFECFDGGDFILSSWRDIEGDRTLMQVFFPDAADTDRARKTLQDAADVVGAPLDIQVADIPDTDWTLAYRLHFKTEVISPRLVVRPVWEEFTPAAGQQVLVMDPGMAFGTGQHATTRACLELIDGLAVENCERSFLDIGCGSGILAVAARLLGFSKVAGFDIDPDAVEVANATAAMNDMEPFFVRGDLCCRSQLSDVQDTTQQYQVVVANVLGPVLIKFAPEVAERLVHAPDSRLVLSGILDELYPEVCQAYAAQGLVEVSSRLIGEWRTGLFKFVN